jgi:hypothetical protein
LVDFDKIQRFAEADKNFQSYSTGEFDGNFQSYLTVVVDRNFQSYWTVDVDMEQPGAGTASELSELVDHYMAGNWWLAAGEGRNLQSYSAHTDGLNLQSYWTE